MQRVRLGRTDLYVSAVGLGCGGHSRLGMATGHDEAHAEGIVRHALDLGITFIDTARAYGTEVAVGKAIRGRRDQVVISTKSSAGQGQPGQRAHPFTAAELAARLDESLVKLGTDYVDVFHLHGVLLDQYEHCAQVLVPELRRQQQAGKIRFVGATEAFGFDTSHRMLRRALPDDLFDVIMVGFNLLNPSARASVFPLTLKHDVGTLIMFAVRRALSRPDVLRDLVADLVRKGEVDAGAVPAGDPLEFLAAHRDVRGVVEAAYRFCRHEPGAHVVLTGTGSREHLTENVGSILGGPLPAELAERLAAVFGRVDSVSGN
jgi:aryl-alcohol dehydrogenase-like predicted oxidoreductase